MKKSIFALSFFAAFLLCGLAASAQINVNNGTNCPVMVLGYGMDMNCNIACQTAMVTVPANSQTSIPFACGAIDAVSTSIIRVYDPGSGQGVAIGNSCGVTPFATYNDCQFIQRTASYFGGGANVFVNIQ